jgi:hypothetical protein
VAKVPPGTVLVGVTSRDPRKGRTDLPGQTRAPPGQGKAGQKEPAPEGWFPLPAKYENPRNSGLSCTIAPGRVTHNIDLEGEVAPQKASRGRGTK